MTVTLIDTPFASSGDVTTIPDAVQPDGSVSFTSGYGDDYETAVASGGLNIERAKMNYLFNIITAAINQYQSNGTPDYYAAISSGSGYGLGAKVNVGSVTYRSLIGANPDMPPSANWTIDAVPLMDIQGLNATGKTYAVADWGNYILRQNGGVAMADTLPGTSGGLPNGWVGYIKNVDTTAVLTVTVGSGGTIFTGTASGSFIRVIPGETWMVQSQGSGNYNCGRIISATISSPPLQGAFSNLKIITNSNTTGTITASGIILQDSNLNTRRISSVSVGYNTATSGAGGLDAGSIAANTWYYEYVIFNNATTTPAALLSLSATAPTLPSGYAYVARVGATRTDGSSNLVPKVQEGRDAQYTSPPITLASGTAANAATSISGVCPTTAGKIKAYVYDNNIASAAVVSASPNSSYGSGGTNPPALAVANANTTPVDSVALGEFVLESSNIYYTSGSANGFLFCIGYTDNL